MKNLTPTIDFNFSEGEKEIFLFKNVPCELDEKNPYISALIAQGHLVEKPETKPEKTKKA